MKRSEIATIIIEAKQFAQNLQVPLPPFADWDKMIFKNLSQNHQIDEIIDNRLGWDVTDFDKGDFFNYGLTALTMRNGNFNQPDKYPKPYAEKMLLVEDGQILPLHFHWEKTEDIINRGGGVLQIKLYNATPQEALDQTHQVHVVMDGVLKTFTAGSIIELLPGQSITLTPRIYHQWQAKPGLGKVMLFEVSSTNDDSTDNRFYEKMPRMSQVTEDIESEMLLVSDYDEFLNK
ncbi:D-lyxose/D-mannose family sugar isomerase [Weissella coleopterorum]|uniref:D-lyxose ketol-isomerase n=1 Tax=Weissella coleopterorum TaxID=2714949 RepID=A0A6G8AYL7_9LACO|nr:D-lyxose/D-mannose family sugar isomerase [Weissella coleopterorum]QIL50158.1 D-lyxose/D-mannose family sugar isomerase [Weissella coleopterorum]